MKKKIIYSHVAFLIIIALILSIFYKNYLTKKSHFVMALDDIKSKAFWEIRGLTLFMGYIISDFDKGGFSMENILDLRYKVELATSLIDAIFNMDIYSSSEICYYLLTMTRTLESLNGFLIDVSKYIENGNKPFYIFGDNNSKLLIKTKKDIYNELLLYYKLFSKLDLEPTKSSTGTELFNKFVKNWDVEEVKKVVYLIGRTKK